MRKQPPLATGDPKLLANSSSDRKVTELMAALNEFEMIAVRNCGLLIDYVGERVCMIARL